MPSLGFRRADPNPVHPELLGELSREITPALGPDLLQAADIGARLSKDAPDRGHSLLPWTEAPPQIPGRDPNRTAPTAQGPPHSGPDPRAARSASSGSASAGGSRGRAGAAKRDGGMR